MLDKLIVVFKSNKTLRNKYSILSKMVEEIGEVSQEVNVQEGFSYKTPGEDGIIGECVDLILATVDLIVQCNPNIKEDELNQIANNKINKWLNKISNEKT